MFRARRNLANPILNNLWTSTYLALRSLSHIKEEDRKSQSSKWTVNREEGAEGTTHFVFSWTINGWVWENKMKQRMVMSELSQGAKTWVQPQGLC